jgi:hypothetical protein
VEKASRSVASLVYFKLRVFLGEWFPCSFGSEITPQVWGVGLFAEGGGEENMTVGNGGTWHSASCS